MRELDKELLVAEICRVTHQEVFELELTYDYIIELFKHWQVQEYSDLFYDTECPYYNCDELSCDNCRVCEEYKGSRAQLSYNNWFDTWGRDTWGEPQQTIDNRVKDMLINILDDDDLEWRLWTFDMDDHRYIYYYNRDRFSDNWFLFERRK